jgi:hypothetical protein
VYLKDWHLAAAMRARPTELVPMFATPRPLTLCGDWLGEFCALRRDGGGPADDDFSFVYLGPAGSTTLLHTDVLGSYSWSSNIVGRKRWVFFPPDQQPLLLDQHGRMVEDVRTVDPVRFPHFHTAVRLELVQEGGETVFVPSGWYHQVENLEPTLSVNANWVGCCNIHQVLDVLRNDLALARSAISDCADAMGAAEFDAHCQMMLKANSGFDFWEFFLLLQTVARARLATIASSVIASAADSGVTTVTDATAGAVSAAEMTFRTTAPERAVPAPTVPADASANPADVSANPADASANVAAGSAGIDGTTGTGDIDVTGGTADIEGWWMVGFELAQLDKVLSDLVGFMQSAGLPADQISEAAALQGTVRRALAVNFEQDLEGN